MISNRLAMLGTRNIVYTLYELQLQANNEFIRPDFFYLLIYGRASPKILAPPEK